ncbi:MAG: hypothetical protein K5694_01390 [Bacilli bacterium]|nr:hypothetical protein [Bacilli bacterium]
MKRNFTLFSLIGFGALSIASASVALSLRGATDVKPNAVYGAVATDGTDYDSFRLMGTSGSFTPDSANKKITYSGSWADNYLVTDQFDTRAGDYSFKTHVSRSDWTAPTSGDNGIGFVLYVNNDNYVDFFLKWTNVCSNSIAEAVFKVRSRGEDGNYASALLPSGAYAGRGEYVDVWSDGSNWGTSVDGANINLRTGSTITPALGFDMTLHVNRVTYADRLADVIYLQIDGYALDGTTPLTVYSPRYAVDCLTNPEGEDSAIAERKYQLGFNGYSNDSTELSDIVFTDKNTVTEDVEITRYGTVPTSYSVADNKITVDNDNFCDSFMMTDLAYAATDSFDIEVAVSGTGDNTEDNSAGFTYYFDDENYFTFYFKWDGTLATVAVASLLPKVDGTDGAFIDRWTDNGYTKDSEEYLYNNVNTIRSETELTIASGFKMGLKKVREDSADVFRIRITGADTTGVIHTWYAPELSIDSYVSLSGNPKIGLYAYNAGPVTFSNMKVDGKPANVSLSVRELARAFTSDYMKMSEVSTSDGSDTGACRGETGYYAAAKAAWNKLDADARTLFLSDSEFSDAKARLLAWATANNEVLDTDANTLGSNYFPLFNNASESNNTFVVVAAIAATAIATLAIVGFALKKKKHN